MTIFKGSGVAIATPFNADGSIDYKRYEELVQFHLDNGTDAIVACGTTGESSTLSDEEQLGLIKLTVDLVKKKVPVIAGTGSNDTKHAIHLSVESEKHGADALLLVTPYYNKATQKGLVAHYSQIAESTKLPMIVYSVPSRTGLNIEAKTALALADVPNIAAIKEASGNISQVAEIAALCGDKLDIYSGNDDQILPVLALGGKGVISVIANIAPRQTHDLVEKFLQGDHQGALELQLGMLSLVKALFCELSPIPVKTALQLMGMGEAHFRAPIYPMEEQNVAILKKEMQAYGLI